MARNILFIMCDQLRWDYLSCTGHPTIRTPNIDALAARGVRFSRAYAQSTICGSSRMSFYTGRYVDSHGAAWNNFPLKVGEMTLGDYLRPLGRRTVLVGKTHMAADTEGMARLGIDPDSTIGTRVAECGFDPYERDDGLHGSGPAGRYDPRPVRYNEYLRQLGYAGDDGWDDWANAGEDEHGNLLSGWLLRNSTRPARVAEEHSETPYMTRRAMEFIDDAGDLPWCLHLSYIKPHWPCIAPAPYHAMYGAADVPPPVRSEAEKADAHPIYQAFLQSRVSKSFSRDEVREAVIPAYMGLITQIDDQIGVLMAHLEKKGLTGETMIVFTSDHGDYLGDHWMGEKDLFHEPSVRVPLIVVDPTPEADAARGSVCDALVEAIDLVPTFVQACGGTAQPHRLEGLALQPWLHGQRPEAWREYAISEYDYSSTGAAVSLGVRPLDARLFMVADRRWKYIHAPGFRPMLFDLESDPEELRDLGADPAHREQCERMYQALARWGLRQSQRTAISDERIAAMRGASVRKGILLGFWDESELPDELVHEKWRGARAALARRGPTG
ncbi:alkaline phosphatase family protein [Cupriavidus respiraculi]|uniref:Multifunctional alkaline phosphatase superfamily protein n=1 Tax=Cupriavidus respiraculi TaxID=195930 RepID=A0ABM8WKZ0_9BURK|nr:alkaline phosphatase family protein [Cupriavidus respiraculi]MBY4948369.1 alkaline phosphatase family protein [Cupriavidus respiraculi]CAG9168045.1 Multifunctional alkaline phosphatase superfamily protein [Cupriavidus respiraculi]